MEKEGERAQGGEEEGCDIARPRYIHRGVFPSISRVSGTNRYRPVNREHRRESDIYLALQ